MELNYDWRNFQSLFWPRRRSAEARSGGTIYLIVDGNVVVSAFSEGENLVPWLGATSDEVAAAFPQRDLVIFEREKVDRWMRLAVGLPHFYDQVQFFREEAKPKILGTSGKKREREGFGHRHFLLQAIQSGWQKFFPSTYGIYVQLVEKKQTKPVSGRPEGNSLAETKLLIIVQRGRVSSFQVPDLSSISRHGRIYPAEVVKYLSSKYLVPIQGIFVSPVEWYEWSELGNPWPRIAKAIQSDRNMLVPFRWSLVTLISLQAFRKGLKFRAQTAKS